MHPGAARGERLPARAATQFLRVLVGQFGVGDGHLADEAAKLRLLRGGLRLGSRLEHRINENVQPTDEHARDAGDARQISTARGERIEAVHVRLGHLAAHRARKEEGDVDVDALTDELPDGRNPLKGRRNLDHQVIAVNLAPQASRLGERCLGIVREVGRDLHADVAVTPVRLLVDGKENVGCLLNVFDG